MNDLTSNALASLDGGLGELGLGILGVDGTVADSKDAILAFDEEGAVGSNAATSALLKSPIRNRLVGTDASGPNDHVGRESLAVLEEHGIFAHLSDGGIGAHVHAALLQLAPGVVAQRWVEGHEEVVGHLDERHVDPVGGHIREDRRDAD